MNVRDVVNEVVREDDNNCIAVYLKLGHAKTWWNNEFKQYHH